ncbi:GNAT family N-acetyltransferase [Pseudahrensia aquimaris]|uniref:GNAT family N-acetyltransferase n=1 Tax=Pseudahrensia aquimaris TaxID=744461 RepID=A0ABW3FET5_9HYPH
MTNPSLTIRPERLDDAPLIETITWSVFGPGMTARAAYVLREGVDHEMPLSFVAELNGAIIGTVRLTKVCIGDDIALMLGPLAVLTEHKSKGAGKLLMAEAVKASREHSRQGGPKAIMLVGDEPYYGPFGFKRVPAGSIVLPRPADPNRILVCALEEGVVLGGVASRFIDR